MIVVVIATARKKISGLQRDSKPWLLRQRCSDLPLSRAMKTHMELGPDQFIEFIFIRDRNEDSRDKNEDSVVFTTHHASQMASEVSTLTSSPARRRFL